MQIIFFWWVKTCSFIMQTMVFEGLQVACANGNTIKQPSNMRPTSIHKSMKKRCRSDARTIDAKMIERVTKMDPKGEPKWIINLQNACRKMMLKFDESKIWKSTRLSYQGSANLARRGRGLAGPCWISGDFRLVPSNSTRSPPQAGCAGSKSFQNRGLGHPRLNLLRFREASKRYVFG